ncbi:MAG TPA: hypothetical protein VGM50_14055 [Gemmatimonadaceae bacterium]|jgi:hypothetical protein
MARQGRRVRPPANKKRATNKSDYFTQPGKRGSVIVLRKPIGNRATAKVCGVMPSRVHAKMLITQLERAESVVKDLFMEATDDGIEALEAVLAACCKEVMERGPKVRDPRPDEVASDDDTPDESTAAEG